MPRALMVINPVASRSIGDEQLAAILRPLRDRGWSVAVQLTSAPGGGAAVAREAVAAGYEVVIAGGGDGTVNEVVQGLAATDAVLGVLPLGMVNIWAGEIGLPARPAAAAAAIASGEVRRVDLGVVDWDDGHHRFFLLMAGIGYDAEVVRRTGPRLKRLLGPLAYAWHGVVTAVTGIAGTFQLDVAGRVLRRDGMLLVAGNTRLYAGRARITPRARADDGLLDLCLFTGRGFWRSARYAAEVLARSHLRDPGVFCTSAPRVAVRTEPPLPVQVDGEFAGWTPLALRSAPLALRVIVPAGTQPAPLSGSGAQLD